MTRLNIDEYMIELVKLVAKRGTCNRKQVGAIVSVDGRIISTGYNGAPRGFRHCECIIVNNHCVRAVHAEQNALLFAGRDAEGATLYCTTLPCEICFKLAIQVGIKKIIYIEDYNKDSIKWILDESTIEIEKR